MPECFSTCVLGGDPVTGDAFLLFSAWLSGLGTGFWAQDCLQPPQGTAVPTGPLVRTPPAWCARGQPAPAQPVGGLLAFPHPHHRLLCTPTPARHKKKTSAKGKATPQIKTQEKLEHKLLASPAAQYSSPQHICSEPWLTPSFPASFLLPALLPHLPQTPGSCGILECAV